MLNLTDFVVNLQPGDIVIPYPHKFNGDDQEFAGKLCVFIKVTKSGLFHLHLLADKKKTVSIQKSRIHIPLGNIRELNEETSDPNR